MRLKALFLVVAIALISAGCGGGDAPASETPAATPDATPTAAATPMGTASIAGTISFDGAAPARTPVRMKPECMDQYDEPPLSDNVIVTDGKLKSVFVHVSAGLPDGYSFPPPSEPAVLDQEGCMYVPHVLGMQTGQTFRIENSDPFQHNIHPVPEANRGFNESTPNEGDFLEKRFLVPEKAISVKCDVHGWMLAYAFVLDHPYFGVSGDDGSFSITGLPAGSYTIEAWHEEFGTQTMEVTVGDGEAATADFTFAAAG